MKRWIWIAALVLAVGIAAGSAVVLNTGDDDPPIESISTLYGGPQP